MYIDLFILTPQDKSYMQIQNTQ